MGPHAQGLLPLPPAPLPSIQLQAAPSPGLELDAASPLPLESGRRRSSDCALALSSRNPRALGSGLAARLDHTLCRPDQARPDRLD